MVVERVRFVRGEPLRAASTASCAGVAPVLFTRAADAHEIAVGREGVLQRDRGAGRRPVVAHACRRSRARWCPPERHVRQVGGVGADDHLVAHERRCRGARARTCVLRAGSPVYSASSAPMSDPPGVREAEGRARRDDRRRLGGEAGTVARVAPRLRRRRRAARRRPACPASRRRRRRGSRRRCCPPPGRSVPAPAGRAAA